MDLKNLVLRPNCLLTQSDLVFIPGPRSLFFYKKPFGLLPEYLYEHGYKSQILSLPFRGISLRKLVFSRWLANHPSERFHFIVDSISAEELKELLQSPFSQSVTIIVSELESVDAKTISDPQFLYFQAPPTHRQSWMIPITYRMHQLFNAILGQRTPPYATTFTRFDSVTYDRFLDHCVKLAENEIYA